jgi:hypothetical protein
MSCFSLENQMFLLQAIKDTNDSFQDEDVCEIYENNTNTVETINNLFSTLESMENRLEKLTNKNN